MRILRVMIALSALTIGAVAQEAMVATPTGTIYPGEIIRSDMLRDMTSPDGATSAFAERERLVGKIARRTLLAGRPITPESVADPQALANGALVQIVYEQGGVTITATGQALNAGSVGDAVRVRNMDSGVVVSGALMRDGTVRVGG